MKRDLYLWKETYKWRKYVQQVTTRMSRTALVYQETYKRDLYVWKRDVLNDL